MVYGNIEFQNNKYFFTFDNYVLKLLKTETNIIPIDDVIDLFDMSKKDDIPEILVGKSINQQYNFICFYINGISERTIDTYEFNVYAYIELSNDKFEFDRLSVMADELNWFYNVRKAYDYSIAFETGETKVNLKTFEQLNTNFNFMYNNNEIDVHFNISRNISNMSRFPITLDSTLSFDFETTDSFTFLLDIYGIIKNFIMFITYRQNINIYNMAIKKKSKNGKYRKIGNFHVKSSLDTFLEDKETMQKRIINFDSLKSGCSKLMYNLGVERIYLQHIPYNTRDMHTITPSRFILVTAAFEWEFSNIYSDVKLLKSHDYKEVNETMNNFIDSLINSYTGKKKKYIKYYKKIIQNSGMNLSEKLIHAFKEHSDNIDIFIKNLYVINGITDVVYNDIAKRIQIQRNNYAHGNIDKELEPLVILDLMCLEWLLYSMILRDCGVDTLNIKRSINKLFNRHFAI